jgi:predicted ATPase
MEIGVAERDLGLTCYAAGEFSDARNHCERALGACDPEHDREALERSGEDTGAMAMSCLAMTCWQLGAVECARDLVETAIRRATELDHAPSMAHPLHRKSILAIFRGDAATALSAAEALRALGREHGMTFWTVEAEILAGWARGRLGNPAAGAAELRQGLAAYADQGARAGTIFFQCLLAEIEADTLGADAALARVDLALALAVQLNFRCDLGFLHRLRGDILLKHDPASPAPAEEAYRTAIAIAKQQGARSYELLASLALAKLYQSTAHPAEAHAVLAPALEGFSPTPEMPGIAEAQALLAVLAETDDVKAGAERRQHRQHLQVSYGNALLAARGHGHALMWGKGWAAEETSAAFARVDEFAGPKENPAARFAAYFAECISNLSRGQLRLARETCESFLREAEAEGRAAEATSVRSVLGQVLLNQGELKAARSVLERALADYDPRRDGEPGSRFRDAEVSATAVLAATEWHLGEADRARELINRAVRRAEELSILPITAMALIWRAVLESQRHDASATRDAADAVLALTEEHGVKGVAEFNGIYTHWARGQLLDPEAGADGFRQELAAFMDKGLRLGAPFFHGLLAELEAKTRGPDSALTLIDHALAIAEETEQHLSDPYLYGLRGEFLLARDPSNPGPAEEAFQAAIAIAQEQGARSWGLRAALSLAKRYQSTARPAEAHAILSPALEGFSPTPEMPEIAEAQSLLGALTETEEVKAAEAQHQRRAHLQTAYGQAMMMAKGFAAQETRAAFARATELAVTTNDVSERFAALLGLLAAACAAGELRSARELSLTLSRQADEAGRVIEARVANWWLGLIAYLHGDFVQARTHCERAILAAQDPNADPKVWERFGDPSTAALSVLAATMRQLGEVERARELINTALQRASETGHIGAIVNALFWKSYLEISRGDPLATLSAAEALATVARKHGMAQSSARPNCI